MCERLKSTRVAVVGGGLAGLAAARRLTKEGANATLFEANQWVGGRVYSTGGFIPGKTTEFGAEFIGANHPKWWELAAEYRLPLVEVTENYENLYAQWRYLGAEVPPAERDVVKDDLRPILLAIGADAATVNWRTPWSADRAAEWDNKPVVARLQELFTTYEPKSRYSRSVLAFQIINDNCAELSKQSYLGLLSLVSGGRKATDKDPDGWLGYWELTETHRCAGGNWQLADRLSREITTVATNTPVRQIGLYDDDVRIWWDGGDAAFDFVILAAPPTSWPAVDCPKFGWQPGWFTHGPAVKYVAQFDGRCWSNQSLAPKAIWDQMGSVWENTDNQWGDPPGFGMSMFAGGPYANKTVEHYRAGMASLFPGCVPVQDRLIDWSQWPYVMTGYSVPALGEVTKIGPFLNAPYAGRLWFAGEQTCLGFFGYMEGALQSGYRAADDIIGVVCAEVDEGPVVPSWDRSGGSA